MPHRDDAMPRMATPNPAGRSRCLTSFQITRQHRRFVEFADAVRQNRYIGACYGPPGIGKTLSARTYAAADDWDTWDNDRFLKDAKLPASVLESRTVMWTPHVTTTPRELEMVVPGMCYQLNQAIQMQLTPSYDPELTFGYNAGCPHTELLIVDEADRLKTTGLEQLRDHFDRHDMGLILIGMPGFERRLARYPQLYSRIGFAHQYRPLDTGDINPVLAAYWHQLGSTLHPDNPVDTAAITAITRITGGNFRLIERLLGQVRRILDINHLDTITTEVIEAARENLVIGT